MKDSIIGEEVAEQGFRTSLLECKWVLWYLTGSRSANALCLVYLSLAGLKQSQSHNLHASDPKSLDIKCASPSGYYDHFYLYLYCYH